MTKKLLVFHHEKYFIPEETVTTDNGLGRWTNENSVVSRSKVSRRRRATDVRPFVFRTVKCYVKLALQFQTAKKT